MGLGVGRTLGAALRPSGLKVTNSELQFLCWCVCAQPPPRTPLSRPVKGRREPPLAALLSDFWGIDCLGNQFSHLEKNPVEWLSGSLFIKHTNRFPLVRLP